MVDHDGDKPKPRAKPNPKLLDPNRDPLSYSEDELIKIFEDPAFKETFTLERVGDFFAGKMTYAELLGLTADEAYVMADLAYDMFNMGKLEDAKVIVEGLVISNPYDPVFHNLLANIYAKKEMWEEAVQEYSVVLGLDDKNIGAWVNRAELALQHGELEAAMMDLEKAILLDPEIKDPYGVRARALAGATLGVLDEALAKRGESPEAGAKPAAGTPGAKPAAGKPAAGKPGTAKPAAKPTSGKPAPKRK